MSTQKPYFVHESAVVDQPSTIGAGTKIWHFSHIMKDCSVGERCIERYLTRQYSYCLLPADEAVLSRKSFFGSAFGHFYSTRYSASAAADAHLRRNA